MSTSSDKNGALWAGRFAKELHPLAKDFSSSINYDTMFFREDIAGSIAHVEMLSSVGILSAIEADAICSGLRTIEQEIESNSFDLTAKEDIHLAIEERLTELIGETGAKLHTARSRNDQVALDERLYLKKVIVVLEKALTELQGALIAKAEQYLKAIMPGYTHLQRAQPILLSHHLLAYVEMLDRDRGRLRDALGRFDLSPLGAAAFAGTSFPIDRDHVANSLGFAGIVRNSVDAVSDRDYIIEFVSTCSIIMMHLSRLSEELILWSTKEFDFAIMDDSITTGSSIMPQKKNPDMAELIRGKTGKVYGALVNILTIMKGLPLAYNRDMQEDKQPIFDAAKTTTDCVKMMSVVIDNTLFKTDSMTKALMNGYLTATELADYLVRKGSSFRNAHHITGMIVSHCEKLQCELSSLDLATLQSYSELIGEDVFSCLSFENSIASKRSAGSTSYESVDEQIEYWKTLLAA